MYPDTEFIILIYNPAKEESKYNLENLHKLGIKTIFTSELTSDKLEGKYILPDSHPSALAWQVLTPRFIEELSK